MVADNADLQGKVGSAGAIPPLVVLLSTSAPKAGQQKGLAALMHISGCSTHSRKMVAAAGAITPLVRLMCADLDGDMGIMADGIMVCSIVCNLLADSLVRGSFTSASSFLPLLSLLHTNALECVLVGATRTLTFLAAVSPIIRRELAAAGVIPALFQVWAAACTSSRVNAVQELHLALFDVCTCQECVSKQKGIKGQTSHGASSSSALEHAGAASSVVEPVDPDKLMQELIEEEERAKASEEAKAQAKKSKMQRQKEKKKVKKEEKKDKKGQANNGEQQSQDQTLAVKDQDADAHLILEQQQHARGSADAGGDGGEPSGSGTAALEGDEEHAGGEREQRGNGSTTATAPNMQTAPVLTARSTALTAPLVSAGPAHVLTPTAVATPASTATTTVPASASASTSVPNTPTAAAAAIAVATATSVSCSNALPATHSASHEQGHPILKFLQPQMAQPAVGQPHVVHP